VEISGRQISVTVTDFFEQVCGALSRCSGHTFASKAALDLGHVWPCEKRPRVLHIE
jgi:hypothetical protein